MLSRIRDLAMDDPVREICGVVLLNKQNNLASVIQVPNVATEDHRFSEFVMDPSTWAQIQKAYRPGRDTTYEVAYRFHSHPFWIAHPSPMDIGATVYPQREIIYSVVYNQFVCYSAKSRIKACGLPKGPKVGRHDFDSVHITMLTEYTLELQPCNDPSLRNETFADWCRRHR